LFYSSKDNPGLIRVLSFLKSHDTEYLSGQDLSDVLRISRVAVWKHIKKIKELGYTIESKQKLGYRLVSNTELLLPWEIIQGLKTKKIGKIAYYFDSINSTQNQAIKMTSDSKNNGAIVIAQKQTGGKGRLGRKWISPKGGIWLSIIFYPEFDISVATLFPIASALALSNALEKCFDIKPELKWPNDITIKGKKVAGILVDASLESNKIENIVLGVGINFDVKIKEIEKDLKNTLNFYGVSSLKKFKKETTPVHLVQTFLIELEKIFDLLNIGQTKKIIKEWTKKSSTIGKNVELITKEGKITGKAIKIDDDGALVISNKKITRVIAGDIIHLPN
jgi:BirA family biotin operon repressor/biotin-[acetyl-CoA-carboxylase] ligase